MAAEAIEAYLESLQQDSKPIPESDASELEHWSRAEQVQVRLPLA